jgi:Protein of unknown function (DUF2786)
MTKAKLLDRIRKLLALTASPNANEAAVARSKAKKLMAEHGLGEQEVLDSETSGKIFEMSMGAEGFASRWKFVLVALVARAHGCEAIGLRRGKLRKVKMVGTKKDTEEASKLFTCLLGEIERIVKIECADPPDEILDEVALGYRRSLRAYLDSFRRGAVTALAERLKAKKQSASSSSPPLGAMVLAGGGKPKAREHVKSKFPEAKNISLDVFGEDMGLDELAFYRGFRRGMLVEMPVREGDLTCSRQ